MSGGRWGYLSFRLEDRAEFSKEVWRLLAVLEHELDWGICGDTCIDCAKSRCAEALMAFFDTQGADATGAIATAQNGERLDMQCDDCRERGKRRGV
jgi:hypothetical protein